MKINELDMSDVLSLVRGSDEIVCTFRGREVWRFERKAGTKSRWEIDTLWGREGNMTDLEMTEYLIGCFEHEPHLLENNWFFGSCGFLVPLSDLRVIA